MCHIDPPGEYKMGFQMGRYVSKVTFCTPGKNKSELKIGITLLENFGYIDTYPEVFVRIKYRNGKECNTIEGR